MGKEVAWRWRDYVLVEWSGKCWRDRRDNAVCRDLSSILQIFPKVVVGDSSHLKQMRAEFVPQLPPPPPHRDTMSGLCVYTAPNMCNTVHTNLKKKIGKIKRKQGGMASLVSPKGNIQQISFLATKKNKQKENTNLCFSQSPHPVCHRYSYLPDLSHLMQHQPMISSHIPARLGKVSVFDFLFFKCLRRQKKKKMYKAMVRRYKDKLYVSI